MSEQHGKTIALGAAAYLRRPIARRAKLPKGDLVFFVLDTVPSWM